MHYGDEEHIEKEKLDIVVYKHGTGKEDYTKKGMLRESSVDYEVTSIQECSFFRPRLLQQILKKPYKFLNNRLSDKPFETWYQLSIKAKDWDIIEIISCDNVNDDKNDIKKLH